jgi:AcrR family transcriptional regulator
MDNNMRRERERQQRYELIVESAELLLNEGGIDSFTMDDIAMRAGFTKKTVYSYFQNKEDLNYEIMFRSFNILNKLIDGRLKENEALDEIDKIKLIGKEIISFSKNYKAYFSVINMFNTKDINQAPNCPNALRCYTAGQHSVDMITEIIVQGIKNGTIDRSIDINKTVITLWANLIGIINLIDKKAQYIMEYFNTDILDTLEYGMDMILNSIKNKKERS